MIAQRTRRIAKPGPTPFQQFNLLVNGTVEFLEKIEGMTREEAEREALKRVLETIAKGVVKLKSPDDTEEDEGSWD